MKILSDENFTTFRWNRNTMLITALNVVIFCWVGAMIEVHAQHRNKERMSAGFEEDLYGRIEQKNPGLGNLPATFSVARTTSLKGHKQKQNGVNFDKVFVNEGGHLNPNTGIFTVPFDGVYQFSYSGAALPHKKLSLQLMKNHYEVQSLAFDGKRRKNPQVQNQQTVLQLDRGDRIWIRLAPNRSFGVIGFKRNGYSTTFTGHILRRVSRDDYAPTNLDGISLTPVQLDNDHSDVKSNRRKRSSRTKRLANPLQNANSNFVAFSVARTTSVFGSDSNRTFIPTSRDGILTYDRVFVNTYDVMNQQTGEFVTPRNGLYYFAYTVGKYPKKKLSVALMKNDNEFQVLAYDESITNQRHMQSQTIILQLERGDKIWLKSYNSKDYAVYSNMGKYITFNGYLLSAM
ncbi:complement C1q tumor necrosis factor-related protein 4-like [Clavelina lepadiformis]|uniref:complement C1q tumor necrosis factor-related protein 4-like n=1 Tax=Clavelina lepadiformis TaxID=159417 RepID=UPI004042DBFE